MRSLILGLSTIALLVAAPASADEAVTTGETDSGLPDYSVVIVEPEDGAVIEGSPDALVSVTIEYEYFGWVRLSVDGGPAMDCPEDLPCTFEVTLAPGLHELEATGEDDAFADQHVITIEVVDIGSATEGPASASVTDSDSGSSDTTATDTGATTADSDGDTAIPSPTSSTTDSTPGSTDGTDGATSDEGTTGDDGTAGNDGGSSGSGDKEGCGCTASPGAPDLLGLALFALVAPWRRRRA